MVNLEKILTVDDLIVEYMVYKVKNGYDPKFLASEFMDFLQFFERKMKIEDVIYDKNILFQRFFERKSKSDWYRYSSCTSRVKQVCPHMEMTYSNEKNDFIVKANYKLSDYDISVINTYFMDGGLSKNENYKGTAYKIRNIIGEYLLSTPKRKIDESIEVDENELMIGKYCSSLIIYQIWDSYIDKQIFKNVWPKQCKDINKFLFDIDLAKIIEIPSIKDELIGLYKNLSKRISILYKEDHNFRASSLNNCYLARANYELLIKEYEKIISIAFGPYEKIFEINLSELIFRKTHDMPGISVWDDDKEFESITFEITNDKVKKLVKSIEKKYR